MSSNYMHQSSAYLCCRCRSALLFIVDRQAKELTIEGCQFVYFPTLDISSSANALPATLKQKEEEEEKVNVDRSQPFYMCVFTYIVCQSCQHCIGFVVKAAPPHKLYEALRGKVTLFAQEILREKLPPPQQVFEQEAANTTKYTEQQQYQSILNTQSKWNDRLETMLLYYQSILERITKVEKKTHQLYKILMHLDRLASRTAGQDINNK